ncbi:hypothetical protein UCRPC4_g02744 [Phaeomoniella chlamydospora]|uniref:DUF4211 domain-containing protein n=1 Tax=Phaeomoniella chlamydospora TaxID=158046 RepID=A0A0G2EPA7_PHACM|nr:hypothetical protein UCRPC4_g02744 [Phaeomoniella chlamydospora]
MIAIQSYKTAHGGVEEVMTLRMGLQEGQPGYLLSSDEDSLPRPSLHRDQNPRRTVRNVSSSSDEPQDDDKTVVVTPAKRKRGGRLVRGTRRHDRQEELDLEEDLEDLEDSTLQQSRTRGVIVNSARDKYRQGLEALKKSRAQKSSPHRYRGESDLEERRSEAQEVDSEERTNYSGTMKSRILSRDELSESSHSERPDSDEDLDQYEDDFVEDDDNAPIGLPLEFSSWATAPPRQHFRNVVEWLVKNKIAPAFGRDDELFKLSFDKIDTEATGQAGSRFVSSTWQGDFKNSLEARPEVQIVKIDNHGGDVAWLENCAACLVDEDETDDDTSTTPSLISSSEPLPPSHRTYPLGKSCASNASTAHKLLHWKYHLNQYILDLLRANGYLTPEQIVQRDSKSQRQREKQAETFIDELESSGEMDELWRVWKLELEGARMGMEGWEDYRENRGRKGMMGFGGGGMWGR